MAGGLSTLRTVFGSIFVGYVLSIFLTGAAFVQGFYYFMLHTDSIRTKAFVITIIFLDLLASGCMTQAMYDYLIQSSDNLSELTKLVPLRHSPTFLRISRLMTQPLTARCRQRCSYQT